MDFASLYPTPISAVLLATPARAVQSLRDVPNLLTKLPPQDWKHLTRWPRQIERLERYHGVACWDYVFGQVDRQPLADKWASLDRCHTRDDIMWFISSPTRWRALIDSGANGAFHYCASLRQITYNVERLLSREIAPLLTLAQIEDLEREITGELYFNQRYFIDVGVILSIKLANQFHWDPPTFHPNLSWRRHLAYAKEYPRHVWRAHHSTHLEAWPAQVFWLSIYLSAGFLDLVVGPWLAVRFFRIISRLPVELQLLICNQVYNCLDDTISSDMLRDGRWLLNVAIHDEKNDIDEVDLRGFE